MYGFTTSGAGTLGIFINLKVGVPYTSASRSAASNLYYQYFELI